MEGRKSFKRNHLEKINIKNLYSEQMLTQGIRPVNKYPKQKQTICRH